MIRRYQDNDRDIDSHLESHRFDMFNITCSSGNVIHYCLDNLVSYRWYQVQ